MGSISANKGVDGVKLVSYEPDLMEALIDEAIKQKLGTTAHLGQTGVARMNTIDLRVWVLELKLIFMAF